MTRRDAYTDKMSLLEKNSLQDPLLLLVAGTELEEGLVGKELAEILSSVKPELRVTQSSARSQGPRNKKEKHNSFFFF